jgi:hypothetical protein
MILLVKFTFLALMALVLIQGCTPPKDLLRLPRPLTAAEMETVVSGIRQALVGKTLRLVEARGGEPEILMGRDGESHMVRYKGRGERIAGVTGDSATVRVFNVPDVIVWQFEYSRGPARRCNGAQAANSMVIEYLLNLTTQMRQVTAREPGPRDAAMARPLEMLKAAATLTSGGSRLVGNRNARALVSPMPISDDVVLTGDPAPNSPEFVPIQSLWIDADSLLPIRWEVSRRQAIVGAIDFVYGQLNLRRPAGFEVPQCIP